MPVLQPAELWRRTDRYGIDELFKLQDRKGSEMVLAMTHEEAVTFHVAQVVRSYRDLPLTLYHLQVKERDEPRPARGRAPHARVHHEGLLHLRPRRRGPGRALPAARGRLRPDHGAHRAALLPGRGRRRDDGRLRRRTSTWRPARRARTRSCSPATTQRTSRSRARNPCRSRCPRRPPRPRPSRRPGLTTVRDVAAELGRRGGRADQGLSRDRRRARRASASCSCSCAATTRSTRSSSRSRSAHESRPARSEEIAERLGPVGFHRSRRRP